MRCCTECSRRCWLNLRIDKVVTAVTGSEHRKWGFELCLPLGYSLLLILRVELAMIAWRSKSSKSGRRCRLD